MAKLLVFGKEHSWDEELQIIVNGGFGLICYAIFKDGESDEKIVKFHNCTEFHHRYGNFGEQINTAFESDIHSAGLNIDINRLEGITVEWATERFNEF